MGNVFVLTFPSVGSPRSVLFMCCFYVTGIRLTSRARALLDFSSPWFEFLRRPDRPVRLVFKYRWSIEYLNSTSWVYIYTFYYSGRAQDPRCDRYFRTSNFILLWAYNVVNYYDADVFVDIDFFSTVENLKYGARFRKSLYD